MNKRRMSDSAPGSASKTARVLAVDQPPSGEQGDWAHLPNDVIQQHLCGLLDVQSYANARAACHHWHQCLASGLAKFNDCMASFDIRPHSQHELAKQQLAALASAAPQLQELMVYANRKVSEAQLPTHVLELLPSYPQSLQSPLAVQLADIATSSLGKLQKLELRSIYEFQAGLDANPPPLLQPQLSLFRNLRALWLAMGAAPSHSELRSTLAPSQLPFLQDLLLRFDSNAGLASPHMCALATLTGLQSLRFQVVQFDEQDIRQWEGGEGAERYIGLCPGFSSLTALTKLTSLVLDGGIATKLTIPLPPPKVSPFALSDPEETAEGAAAVALARVREERRLSFYCIIDTLGKMSGLKRLDLAVDYVPGLADEADEVHAGAHGQQEEQQEGQQHQADDVDQAHGAVAADAAVGGDAVVEHGNGGAAAAPDAAAVVDGSGMPSTSPAILGDGSIQPWADAATLERTLLTDPVPALLVQLHVATLGLTVRSFYNMGEGPNVLPGPLLACMRQAASSAAAADEEEGMHADSTPAAAAACAGLPSLASPLEHAVHTLTHHVTRLEFEYCVMNPKWPEQVSGLRKLQTLQLSDCNLRCEAGPDGRDMAVCLAPLTRLSRLTGLHASPSCDGIFTKDQGILQLLADAGVALRMKTLTVPLPLGHDACGRLQKLCPALNELGVSARLAPHSARKDMCTRGTRVIRDTLGWACVPCYQAAARMMMTSDQCVDGQSQAAAPAHTHAPAEPTAAPAHVCISGLHVRECDTLHWRMLPATLRSLSASWCGLRVGQGQTAGTANDTTDTSTTAAAGSGSGGSEAGISNGSLPAPASAAPSAEGSLEDLTLTCCAIDPTDWRMLCGDLHVSVIPAAASMLQRMPSQPLQLTLRGLQSLELHQLHPPLPMDAVQSMSALTGLTALRLSQGLPSTRCTRWMQSFRGTERWCMGSSAPEITPANTRGCLPIDLSDSAMSIISRALREKLAATFGTQEAILQYLISQASLGSMLGPAAMHVVHASGQHPELATLLAVVGPMRALRILHWMVPGHLQWEDQLAESLAAAGAAGRLALLVLPRVPRQCFVLDAIEERWDTGGSDEEEVEDGMSGDGESDDADGGGGDGNGEAEGQEVEDVGVGVVEGEQPQGDAAAVAGVAVALPAHGAAAASTGAETAASPAGAQGAAAAVGGGGGIAFDEGTVAPTELLMQAQVPQAVAAAGLPLMAGTAVDAGAPLDAEADASAARRERRIQMPHLAQLWRAVRAETHGSFARYLPLVELQEESWTSLSSVALPPKEQG